MTNVEGEKNAAQIPYLVELEAIGDPWHVHEFIFRCDDDMMTWVMSANFPLKFQKQRRRINFQAKRLHYCFKNHEVILIPTNV